MDMKSAMFQPRNSLSTGLAVGRIRDVASPSASRSHQENAVHLFRHEDLAPHALPGIEHRTLASLREGLRRLEVWRQTLAPGATTPPHSHDCDEVVVVLAGSGEAVLADRVVAFAADSTLVLPAGELHTIRNTGRVDVELLASFPSSPPGTLAPDGRAIALPWDVVDAAIA